MSQVKRKYDHFFQIFSSHLKGFYFNQYKKCLINTVLDGLAPDIPSDHLAEWYFSDDLTDELAFCYPISESETIGEYFLRKRGWREGAMARLYFSAVLAAPTAIWEMIEVIKGSTAYVKQVNVDMAPIMVAIPKCSLVDLDKQPFFVGKVLSLEPMGLCGLTISLGSVPLPRNAVERVIERVDALTSKEALTPLQSQYQLQRQALMEKHVDKVQQGKEFDDGIDDDLIALYQLGDIYQAGLQAFRLDQAEQVNPYSGEEGECWSQGWQDGQQIATQNELGQPFKLSDVFPLKFANKLHIT
ncbi:hypothetical protein [Shewanella baltica]|uniref:Uncharacterized protein n=1 Tax=Shewanella baltica (strain OS155 / ATCC BAA-1091) TaxID=325240 RepID=A3DB45_SHEB5|nr:hypothetical protein [Shewanella baltica]ABN63958.1 hypothetical protein Sbal_4408 [Shewanella baltica OS155]